MPATYKPRLPHKPIKPYIPSDKREARALTIALGFHSLSGIVLCSDSQFTIPQYMKYSGRKLFFIPGADRAWSIGLTYCGDPERADRIYEQMKKSVCGQATLDKDTVRQCFEDALADVRGSIINPSFETIDALCGFCAIPDKVHLFVGKSGAVTEKDSLVLLGCGDSSLSRYLENLLPTERASIGLEIGLLTGAYIVEQAKKYVDGCGGDLQMLLMQPGGCPTILGLRDVAKLTELADLLDQTMKRACIVSMGVEMEDLDYDKGQSLEQVLMNGIRNLKTELQRLHYSY